ncbi:MULTISPECIES: universal stress protein [Natrinema]|uniref:UspA domain protein n=1 Tax=Natrinema gari JCM 14663 TaxID=1230459 RepID=L9YNJ9_9EURY|nr:MULTISPECIES: universal stress protein [Natrinema]AFO58761.1 UspA domain protein [Natrinema sp. J7-2]ELY75256.1 UspA domain protein [Natrinema gari JCM 14663]
MYDRILVPTDGSETSKAAVAHALDLADQYGADVHALYVVDTDSMSLSLGAEQVDRIEQGQFSEMGEVRERADRATGYVADRARERGLESVENVSAGKPHSLISDYIDDNDIDLVVMGSHGRSGIRRALLGSVTERTLRSTHVPVLVVDIEGQETE